MRGINWKKKKTGRLVFTLRQATQPIAVLKCFVPYGKNRYLKLSDAWSKTRFGITITNCPKFPTMTEKKCRDCGQIKPGSEFYSARANRDGLHSYCKKCQNRRTAAYIKKGLSGSAATRAYLGKIKFCTWIEDEDGNWETACDHLHLFYAGGPVENKYRFCPYCGQKIKERRGDG